MPLLSSNDRQRSAMLRKVRSMDSVNLCCSNNNNGYSKSRQMASRFSADETITKRTCASPPSIQENVAIDSTGEDHHGHTGTENNELGNCEFLGRGMLVGYLSVMCLLFVTITNYTLQHLASSSSSSSSSPKLGAAALGSLTSVFSPILPFTGGADLRRGEYSLMEMMLPSGTSDRWGEFFSWGKLISSTQHFDSSSTPSFVHSISRGGGAADRVKRERLIQKYEPRVTVLSAPESFVHLDEIGKMSLANVTTLIQYAIENSREGEQSSSREQLSPRMKQVIQSIDAAITESRSADVLPALTTSRIEDNSNSNNFGDIDALQFCATMRIFAEWRVLRQVPEGYKGYAMGMGLGQKDVVQNLVKVETAAFHWIDERREMIRLQKMQQTDVMTESTNTTDSTQPLLVLRSPTLRELLQDEIDFDVHKGKLPRLKEKSAAMGLLWVRRQLHYQTCIFANIVSNEYANVPESVSAAYKEVYNLYHGWAVQKIFNYSFQAAPHASEIYKIMNPEYLEQVMKMAENMVIDDSPKNDSYDITEDFNHIITVRELHNVSSIPTMHNSNKELEIKSKQNPVERFGNHIAKEWDKLGQHVGGELDKFGRHIGNEWDKLAGNVVHLFGDKRRQHAQNPKDDSTDVRGGARMRQGLYGEELETFVADHMAGDALAQMKDYLKAVKPLLNDLKGLFEEMDMDDPTKV